MKKIFAVFAMLVGLFCIPSAHAQTRILTGITGGDAFDNLSLGGSLGIEVPVLHRFEFDLRDKFSPYERHTALGTGKANLMSGSGIVWLTKSFGLTATTESSSYSVTQVSKSAVYIYAGPIYRTMWWEFPVRIEGDYIRQASNGLYNGIETSQLQGGALSADVRLGCAGQGCFRLKEQIIVGHVLTQGNPLCDGTLGNGSQVGFSPCPRSSALSGGVSATISWEFPRHKATENNPF